MGRRLALMACVALLLVGCKGSGQSTEPVDPFFGRVRIDPPRTGTIGTPPTAPYNPPLRPNPLRVAPGTPVGNVLPGRDSWNGSAGWVPAPPTAPTLPGQSTGSAPPGAANVATNGLLGQPSHNWGAATTSALGQNAPPTAAGIENRAGPFQPFSSPLAGDRIVIPPAAREVPGTNADSAISHPVASAASLGGTAGRASASTGSPAIGQASVLAPGFSGTPGVLGPGAGQAAAPQDSPLGRAPNLPAAGTLTAPWPAATPANRVAAPRGIFGVSAASGAGGTASLAAPPTMSRPTIDLATQREPIVRTLNPAGAAGPPLPRPVDAASLSPASAPPASVASSGISSTPASGGRSGLPGPEGTPTLSTGRRFPNRLVDITELPIAPERR